MIPFFQKRNYILYSRLSRNLYHHISFDLVIFLKIIELLEYKTTLISCSNFLYIVLETL